MTNTLQASPSSPAVKIFGREPAAWVGLIEAALVLGMAFWAGLSPEMLASIMAVVVAGLGLYTAYATKNTNLAVVVGFVKAALVLAAGFGLALTDVQTAGLISLVTVGFGFYNRQQTSPVADKREPEEELGDEPLPEPPTVVPDEPDWAPPGYQQPLEDDVVVTEEHSHPLETDQAPRN